MPDNPVVTIIDVTPTQAEVWLSKNPTNRNIRRPLVDSYARDMAADN